jgi:hypothetical protein
VDELDFGRRCDDDFIAKLPNLKTGEPAAGFRRRARLREADEIGAELDLAYCLHWAVREASLAGNAPPPGMVPSYVVVERRRALEWLAGKDDWDATSLDT